MSKLLLAGGGITASVVAVPLLALLAVLGIGAAPPGCRDGGGLAADAEAPTRARPWVEATHAACPVLPRPWIAAVMAQESAFDPDAYADDVNGGTWGLFQLNAAIWQGAYGAGWSADRDGNGRPDVRDAAIHAQVAGEYRCERLAGVRALRAAHRTGPATRELSELEALIVAHNAGESRLATYPDLPAVTAAFLGDVAARVEAWSACANGPASFAGPPGKADEAIRVALSMVGTRSGWYRLCDRLVCRAYGYANSGYPTDAAHWDSRRAHTARAASCRSQGGPPAAVAGTDVGRGPGSAWPPFPEGSPLMPATLQVCGAVRCGTAVPRSP